MADVEYLTIPHLNTRTITRLFGNIRIEPVTGCWTWTGRTNRGGYCHTTIRRIGCILIHRAMYAWLVGPIPCGRSKNIPVIDHLCKNRRCCNPVHLELVPDSVNLFRSNAACMVNKRKRYCINGHLLPPPRLISGKKWMRTCRICKAAYDRRIRPNRRSAQTHCLNGHPLPAKINGRRLCLICAAARKRTHYLAHRDEYLARSKKRRSLLKDKS